MNWKRIWGSYGLLLLAAAVLFLAGICVGSTGTTLPQVARILLGDSSDQAAYRIVWDIRLPRRAIPRLKELRVECLPVERTLR